MPGAFPALDGSKIVNGPADAQIALVLNGKTGTAMPAWKQLSDADIAAVITYTRNSWGNKSGDVLPARREDRAPVTQRPPAREHAAPDQNARSHA